MSYNKRHKKEQSKEKTKKREVADPGALIKARANFPEEVRKAASRMPKEVKDTVIARELRKGRRDLRCLNLVTIDGEDTKDVDDAVSIERKENGNWLLGVHIADVSHYVKYGSPLDLEAFRRGTSVYFPGMVLPMLPKALSNGICSLNVGVPRLALSVEMEMDGHGNIVNHEIYESVIQVRYKITYNQLYQLFTVGEPRLKKEFAPYLEDLTAMKALAEIRHQLRKQRGALDFDFPETKVVVDGSGKPVDVYPYHTTFANNMIEEFMLAANETIAEHFYWLDVPFLYRNHGAPEAEKIDNLAQAVRTMGFTLKGRGGEIHSHAIQSMLEKCKGMRTESVISMLALRAMQKAEYSGENKGHFGLAAEYYTHFTSPIRRYPDLFIHRVIKWVLHGELGTVLEEELRGIVFNVAEHSSETEREAESAERQYTDIKVAEYMADYVGEKFTGIISGITSFGIFVRLPNSAEGLLFYNNMPDYMIYDEKRMLARGESTKRTFAIGDPLKVLVADVKIRTGQIEFLLG